MSTLPGPIISFGIDLQAAAARELAAVKKRFVSEFQKIGQESSRQFADQFQQKVARLNADLARGLLTTKQAATIRQQLVGLADKELAILRAKESLTNKELTSLRGITKERERQAFALKNDPLGAGLTRGTQAAALFFRFTGVQIPQSITRLIGQNQILGRAFEGAFKAGVVALVIREVFRLADSLTGVTDELQRIAEESQRTFASVAQSSKILLGPQTIGDVAGRIRQQQQTIEKLQRQAGVDQPGFFGGIRNLFNRSPVVTFFSATQGSLLNDLKAQKEVLNELFVDHARLLDIQRRTEPIEVLKLQNAARLEGLQGIAKVRQAELDSIALVRAEVTAKVKTERLAQAEINAIKKQAAAEEKRIRQQLAEELKRVEDSIALVGASRLDAIGIRAKQEIAAIQRQLDAGGLSNEERQNLTQRQAKIAERAERELQQARNEIAADGVQAILRAEAAAAFGRERIEREYLATLQQITQEERRLGIELADARVAAEIDKNTKLKELARRNAEETRTIQESAAIAILAPGRRAVESMRLEQERLLRQLRESYDRGEIEWEDFNARREAIWQETNARMLDEFASELEGFFDDLAGGNLGKRITDNLRKAAIRNLAGALQGLRVGGPLGGILADVLGLPSLNKSGSTTTTGIGGIGGIFRTPGINPNAKLPGAGGGTVAVPASTAQVNTASATIQSLATMTVADLKTMHVVAANVFITGKQSTSGGAASLLSLFFGGGQGQDGGFFGGSGGGGSFFDVIFRGQPGGGQGDSGGGSSSSSGGPFSRGNLASTVSSIAVGVLGLKAAADSPSKIQAVGIGALSGLQIGGAVGGPIGAAIGAVAGAIFGGIFGGPSKAEIFEQKVQRALKRQTAAAKLLISDPFAFRFANLDTLSDTFGSTFADVQGGGFVASRSAPAPMVQNVNINAIDTASFEETMRRRGSSINRALSFGGAGRFGSVLQQQFEPA